MLGVADDPLVSVGERGQVRDGEGAEHAGAGIQDQEAVVCGRGVAADEGDVERAAERGVVANEEHVVVGARAGSADLDVERAVGLGVVAGDREGAGGETGAHNAVVDDRAVHGSAAVEDTARTERERAVHAAGDGESRAGLNGDDEAVVERAGAGERERSVAHGCRAGIRIRKPLQA